MIRNINHQAANDSGSRFQTAHTFGRLWVMFESNFFNFKELLYCHDAFFVCSVAEGISTIYSQIIVWL